MMQAVTFTVILRAGWVTGARGPRSWFTLTGMLRMAVVHAGVPTVRVVTFLDFHYTKNKQTHTSGNDIISVIDVIQMKKHCTTRVPIYDVIPHSFVDTSLVLIDLLKVMLNNSVPH